jgi:hypothetical protein
VVVVAVSTVVVVSMEEVSAVAVSTAAVLVVGSTGEASAVALSTAVVVSVGDVSPVAVSMAVAFVATVLVVTDSLMMSSSAASAFRGGGAGTIRTDITATTITRTITMDTAGTHIMDTADTVTTVAPVMGIAMEADRGISGVGDKPGYGSSKIRDEATCESSKSGRSMFGDKFGE